VRAGRFEPVSDEAGIVLFEPEPSAQG